MQITLIIINSSLTYFYYLKPNLFRPFKLIKKRRNFYKKYCLFKKTNCILRQIKKKSLISIDKGYFLKITTKSFLGVLI